MTSTAAASDSSLSELMVQRPMDWAAILESRDSAPCIRVSEAKTRSCGRGGDAGSCGNEKVASSSCCSTSSGCEMSGHGRKRSCCGPSCQSSELAALPPPDSAVGQAPSTAIRKEDARVETDDIGRTSEDQEACHIVDLKLLHLACDARTRASDVSAILRLANRIERSVTTECCSEDRQAQGRDTKKKIKTNDGCAVAVAAAAAKPAIRTALFVDGRDGRTPLHRACAPRDEEEVEATEGDDSSAAGADVTSDISDVSDVEEGESDGETAAAHPPAAAIRRIQVPINPKLDAEAAQWTFETTCLLLGLCPGMVKVADSRGETPLHLLARNSEWPSRVITARSMLQFHPELAGSVDRWGNTPLHRAIISLSNNRSDAPSPSALDAFAAMLVDADSSVVLRPNKAGSTPLHLLLANEQAAASSAASGGVYELARYMALARPDAIVVQDSKGFTPLHYCCETDPDLRLVELLLEVEHRWIQTVAIRNASMSILSQQTFAPHVPTSSLLHKDHRGFTPLHLTCLDRAGVGVMNAILARRPGASLEVDGCGQTPLGACWNSHVYCASRFRRALRHAGAMDEGEDEAEFRRWADSLRKELLSGRTGEFWRKVLTLLWAARRAEAGSSHPLVPQGHQASSFSELHAAASVSCPREVLDVAIFLYPHQLCQRDFTGDIPLHAAARSRQTNGTVCDEGAWREEQRRRHTAFVQVGLGLANVTGNGQDQAQQQQVGNFNAEGAMQANVNAIANAMAALPDSLQEDFASSDEESSVGSVSTARSWAASVFRQYSDLSSSDEGSVDTADSRHDQVVAAATKSKCKLKKANGTIVALLAACPESVHIPDASGRLVLHVALEAGKTWGNGVGSIVAADPRALASRDTRTGLYPFMLAATVGRTMAVAEHLSLLTQRTASEAKVAAEKACRTARMMNASSVPQFIRGPSSSPAPPAESHELRFIKQAVVAAEAYADAAWADARRQREELAEDMRGLNTVFILLSCRPELVQTGIP